ncbi:hypothetical protein UlMin_040560 [Ulmus minor]
MITPQIRSHSKASSSIEVRDFSMLPYDVLTKITDSFSLPNLRAAEGMVFLRWGKRFKCGKGGFRPNLDEALDSFLKGTARGSTLAMVDAGLVYWETGKKDKAVALYKRAAVLGDLAGQFNLGVSYLQAKPPNPKEAIKWFYQSANAGYARAQYQLGLCLLHRHRVDKNKYEARWYLKAAEGGYLHAMYNISLCYSFGEGFGSVACALSRMLYGRGKLSYVLDGDNVKHGLNSDLSFKAEDRTENIQRIGECCSTYVSFSKSDLIKVML